MRILAVDDEMLQLEKLEDVLYEVVPDAIVVTTRRVTDCLRLVEETSFDVIFLDVQMPTMSGTELAAKIKQLSPRSNIIFCTAYDDYKNVAMDLRASGYITKPVTAEKVRAEFHDLRYPIEEAREAKRTVPEPAKQTERSASPAVPRTTEKFTFFPSQEEHPLLYFQCFGNFDVFDSNHVPVAFERSKAKELLAYLVLRHGARCSSKEIAARIFDEDGYDKRVQDNFRHVASAMMKALRKVGAEDAVIRNRQEFSINAKKVDCEYFRFLLGDEDAAKIYTGEFMSQYSWAEEVNAYLDSKLMM